MIFYILTVCLHVNVTHLCFKVAAARKFSAEKYVNDYLEDFHKELLPKTYQGHRLPEWLIKVDERKTVQPLLVTCSIIPSQELMEKDKEDAKEKAMQGKEVTRGEQIVKKGETVDQFIQRVWK